MSLNVGEGDGKFMRVTLWQEKAQQALDLKLCEYETK